MRRLVVSLALGILTLLTVASPAMAGRLWCHRDPVIKVDGQVVDILISSYTDMQTSANGPVQIVVTVPVGSTASVYATDHSRGYGGGLSFVHSPALTRTA